LGESSVITQDLGQSTTMIEQQQQPATKGRNQFAPTVINIRANTNRRKTNRRNNSMSSIDKSEKQQYQNYVKASR